MDGFIVIDKPEGMTSHDVVARLRRALGIKRIGHTGTLDPFATGVLPVAVGEATKAIQFLDESLKEYRGTLKLGTTTDTQDRTGKIVAEREWRQVGSEEVRGGVAAFVGDLLQLPPMYSALKRDGVPLYRLARQGKEVEREARPVTVHAIEILRIELPLVEFIVSCSRGTYVRTLAHDIGEKLGTGAHLTELRRVRSGPFTEDRSVRLEELPGIVEKGGLHSLTVGVLESLAHLRELPVSAEGARRISCGIFPSPADVLQGWSWLAPGERVRFSHEGKLAAVAGTEGGKLRLLRVFS